MEQRPKNKDKSPTAVAQEGPEPQPGHWPKETRTTPKEERMVYPGEGMILMEDDAVRQ